MFTLWPPSLVPFEVLGRPLRLYGNTEPNRQPPTRLQQAVNALSVAAFRWRPLADQLAAEVLGRLFRHAPIRQSRDPPTAVRAVDYQLIGGADQYRVYSDDEGDVARWSRVEP